MYVVKLQHSNVRKAAGFTAIACGTSGKQCVASVVFTLGAIGACVQPTNKDVLSGVKVWLGYLESITWEIDGPIVEIQVLERGAERALLVRRQLGDASFDIFSIREPRCVNVQIGVDLQFTVLDSRITYDMVMMSKLNEFR